MKEEQYKAMLERGSQSVRRLNQPAAAASRATINPEKAVFELRPIEDEMRLNKAEREYLYAMRAQGYHLWIQAITLKLGDDCRYTPDFAFVGTDLRFYLDDVKALRKGRAHVEDDALVKLKTAARIYRCFVFRIVWRNAAGLIEYKEIKP